MSVRNKIIMSPEIGPKSTPNYVPREDLYVVMNGPTRADTLRANLLDASKAKNDKRIRENHLSNLETMLHQLFVLEGKLRKEQKDVWAILAQRDQLIASQRQEIDKLRRENKRLLSRAARKPSDNRIDVGDVDVDKIHPPTEAAVAYKANGCLRTDLPKQGSNLYEGKDVKRVCHKPPIAEKPKLNPSGYIVTTCALKSNSSSSKGCNIASTISQLLNEESDHGIVSSGSSEPSSPESTLKQSIPKSLKLSRSQESNNSNTQNRNKKILLLDEHDATSGYNSDTVSEQDHDYENIDLKKSNKFLLEDRQRAEQCAKFVSGTKSFFSDQGKYQSDQPIYSNVQYAEKRLREGSDVIEALNLQVGTVSSLSNNSCSPKKKNPKIDADFVKIQNVFVPKSNVPRSRNNINQLMETEDKNVIMQNFEEFSLDSLDLDSYEQKYLFGKENSPVELTRHSGDGAESKSGRANSENAKSVANSSSGGYEKFLEATGLSQKSILTPSRMLSNHRSMLKPRDIKHRNKLRVYFTGLPTLEEGAISQSGSTYRKHNKKYWREPFL